jgi:hypothetical protein
LGDEQARPLKFEKRLGEMSLLVSLKTVAESAAWDGSGEMIFEVGDVDLFEQVGGI